MATFDWVVFGHFLSKRIQATWPMVVQKSFCSHFSLKSRYSWKVNQSYLHIVRFLHIYHISFWIWGFWSCPYCFESLASLTVLGPSELLIFFTVPFAHEELDNTLISIIDNCNLELILLRVSFCQDYPFVGLQYMHPFFLIIAKY